MARLASLANRRLETRWPCDSTPCIWHKHGPNSRRRPGWMDNISKSGLAYVAARINAPRTGETIEVAPRRFADPIPCEVVRVQPISEGLCVIGCRRNESADAARAAIPRPRHELERRAIEPEPEFYRYAA